MAASKSWFCSDRLPAFPSTCSALIQRCDADVEEQGEEELEEVDAANVSLLSVDEELSIPLPPARMREVQTDDGDSTVRQAVQSETSLITRLLQAASELSPTRCSSDNCFAWTVVFRKQVLRNLLDKCE